MPNSKITNLTDGAPAQSGDEIYVNRGGADRKVTAGSIADLVDTSSLVSDSRQIISGDGLTGGGDLSADRTLAVGAGTGITVNANDVALTIPVAVSSGGTGQTTEAEAVGELIQALTQDATPDPANDFVGTYDASADTGKKVVLNDIITATESQIETVIDTLANLTSIQGVSFTFGAYAATLLNNADEAAFKAAVNLEIGTDVQAFDADLTTLSTAFTTASASGAASLAFHEDTDNGTNRVLLQGPASTADVTVTLPSSAGTLLTAETAAATYQPLDADLTSWAGVTRATGFDTFAATPSSANLASLLTDDAFSMSDAELGAIAGLTSAADRVPYFTGSGTAALATFTAYGRTLVALADEDALEALLDTLPNLTSVQGRTVTLADPNLDVLFGWDDSGSAYKNFALADILTEASPAAGDFVLIYGAEGDLRKVNWSGLPGAGGGISNVVEDLTPQLGGDLDANTFNIGFDDGDGITDDSGNEQLIFQKTTDAVNYIEITNAATETSPVIAVAGSDADIDLQFSPKGTGSTNFTGEADENAWKTTAQFSVINNAGMGGAGLGGRTRVTIEDNAGGLAHAGWFGAHWLDATAGATIGEFVIAAVNAGAFEDDVPGLAVRHTTAGVNYLTVNNATTGNPPSISPSGDLAGMSFGANFTQYGEMTAPSGVANTGRLFTRDNGSGKTQLCVIFGSGAVQVIATEP